MKTIIHTPYKAYNRKEDKWEWVVEVYKYDLVIHTFHSKEGAEEFINIKATHSFKTKEEAEEFKAKENNESN